MVNLIKYEFLRKWRTLLIFSAIVVFINANVLYRVFGKLQSTEFEMMALGSFFAGLLGVFFILYIVDVTYMYSRDLNSKSGYMIFLTPNSGYKILGAKVITGLIEGFTFLLFYLLLLGTNFLGFYSQPLYDLLVNDLAVSVFVLGQLKLTLWEMIPLITANLVTAFISIVVLVLTIFTALSIRKSILAENKFGGLLSFLIFVLLFWLNGNLISLVVNTISKADLFANGIHYFNVISLLQIAFGAVLFFLTAYLLDKRIDI